MIFEVLEGMGRIARLRSVIWRGDICSRAFPALDRVCLVKRDGDEPPPCVQWPAIDVFWRLGYI